MGRKVEMEDKFAKATGFYNGARVRAGTTFSAPPDFEAKWFRPADEAEELVEDARDRIAKELDNPITAIVAKLGDYNDPDLNKLLSAEQSGAARKGLMAKISDEIANRIGENKIAKVQDGPEDAAFS